MFAIVFAAALCFGSVPDDPQRVRFTITDGTHLLGDLMGFEHGRYRVRLEDGRIQELSEDSVRDVVLTPSSQDRPATPSGRRFAEARAEFDKGRYEESLRKIDAALKKLDAQRREL